jgi:hypothetical protein
MSTFQEKFLDFDITVEHEANAGYMKSELELAVGKIGSPKEGILLFLTQKVLNFVVVDPKGIIPNLTIKVFDNVDSRQSTRCNQKEC